MDYYGEESYYEEEPEYFCNTNRYTVDYDETPQYVASYAQLNQITTSSPLWQTNRYLACGINDYIKNSNIIPETALDGIFTKIHGFL